MVLPPRYPQHSTTVDYGTATATATAADPDEDGNNNTDSNPPDYPKLFEEDQAEQGLLESVEARRGGSHGNSNSHSSSHSGSAWQPAVEGERPPLPNIPFQTLYQAYNNNDTPRPSAEQPSSPPPPPPAVISGAVPSSATPKSTLNRHRSNTSSITMDPSTLKAVSVSNNNILHHGAADSVSKHSKKSGGGSSTINSRGSKSSLLSGRGGGHNTRGVVGRGLLGTQPNYAEIAQKMRRMNHAAAASSTTTTTSTNITTDGDGSESHDPSTTTATPHSSTAANPHTTTTTNTTTTISNNHHRRHPSKARALLDAIQEKPAAGGGGSSHTTSMFGSENRSSSHHHHHNSATPPNSLFFPSLSRQRSMSSSGTAVQSKQQQHQQHQSASIFDNIGAPGAPTDVGASSLAMEDTNTDQLITGAMQVERLFRDDANHIMDEHEAVLAEEEEAELYPEVLAHQNHPTLVFGASSSSSAPPPVIVESSDGDPNLILLPGEGEEVTLELTQQQENDETLIDEEMRPLTERSFSYGTRNSKGTGTSDGGSGGGIASATVDNNNNQNSSSFGTTKRGAIPEDRRAALRQRRKQHLGAWQLWKRRIQGCFCDPRYWIDVLYHVIVTSLSFKASVPLTVLAAVFFYQLGDPSPEFLPGQASISWWLLFLARQCVTLDLARLSQWFIIDAVILSSRTAVRLLGPLCTLVAIQSKGWPFCGFSWATIDLFLLHGTQRFQQHWLYWTGITLYEFGNTGLYLLDSPVYTRILLAAMLAGMATTAKRTVVALYFGRRTFVEFKPRLEKILREVIVLSEVAELAMEAEILEASANAANMNNEMTTTTMMMMGENGSAQRPMQQSHPSSSSSDQQCNNRQMNHQRGGTGNGGGGIMSTTVHWSPALNSTGRIGDVHNGENDVDDDDDSRDDNASRDDDDDDEEDASIRGNRYTSSGNHELIHLLEQWDEPKNVMDKTSYTSINDILKFRRALSFMDDSQPFGGAFGPAHNRDSVVRSSEFVFRRLLTLSPESQKLPFEALEMLAHEGDVDGPLDRSKLKTIKRMFRPDKENLLSLLDFVKACDGLYKKLRFFRASVGNASVIDHHLESIIDGIFYFVLLLVLLSVTGLNAWSLLVSISTLLVSISFAVGSSASKYIEGILLIAVRRPYDLGDRIYMMDPSVINSDLGIMVSWFIEDINLFNTTVRYAATNETGTINNGAIANMRIVNGNRSQNAVVWFQLPFRTKILREGRLDDLKAMLETYAKDHPKQWHSYSYCRIDEVHAEKDKLVATIGFQHRSSWQDLAGILEAKSKLMCHVLEYGKKQEINYEELPTRHMTYYAGRLKNGGYREHRDSLHEPENIINDDEIDFGLRRRTKQNSGSTHTEADNFFLSQVQKSHNS